MGDARRPTPPVVRHAWLIPCAVCVALTLWAFGQLGGMS